MLFSTWETFAKKRFEQGFLQGWAKTHGGLEALEEYYAEREGRTHKRVKTSAVRNEREILTERVAKLEKERADRDLMTRIVDLLEQEVGERKRLAERVVELERLIKERD